MAEWSIALANVGSSPPVAHPGIDRRAVGQLLPRKGWSAAELGFDHCRRPGTGAQLFTALQLFMAGGFAHLLAERLVQEIKAYANDTVLRADHYHRRRP